MKCKPVDQLVYECMFPKPRSSDPANFHALLQRSLIPEVRSEVHSFYGHIDTSEAKYPGLDYGNRIHRVRLSRWPWHRRLFRAFDNLRLTPNEIANLTKWEGTRWAKERYEKEQGISIRDTAADGLADWVEPEARETAVQQPPMNHARAAAAESSDVEIESDEEMQSVGTALNQRLRERVARRQAGETDTPLDEEWEQWFKSVIESGDLPLTPDLIMGRAEGDASRIPQSLLPARMLNAARAGQWSEIPDFLHGLVRRIIDEGASSREEATAPASPSMPPLTRSSAAASVAPDYLIASISVNWRRNYSDLRLPAGDGSGSNTNLRLQRTAEAPGA